MTSFRFPENVLCFRVRVKCRVKFRVRVRVEVRVKVIRRRFRSNVHSGKCTIDLKITVRSILFRTIKNGKNA